MKLSYVLSLITVAFLAILSASAGLMLGDVDRIPMHWNLNGVPNSYAPKRTGLIVIPAFGLVTMIGLAVSEKGNPRNRQIRATITVALILIAVHAFFLYSVLGHANKL
ncbi:DUF1648 domain-containing protein [Methylorubrum sp. SB2]|uniref:DUF1648 domain-containing protein n=1 Tax=Methylorubrum subtropicum TaxID=3138812 RepID=UPI00313CB937